ncbi:zinc finger, CCHC-type containing protein [Tanacetum coccineum]
MNVKAAWKAEYKIHSDVACLMLEKMSPALQRQFELYFPQAMLNKLIKMFEKPQAVEIYDLVDTLHICKQAPRKSVSAHVLEMKGYMDQLQAFGKPYDNDMSINLINRSLNKDFVDFIRNFNMHCVGKTISELHALLIDYEKGLKDKAPTPQQTLLKEGENPKKDQACHHCNVVGHWKRNCPLYLKELRTNKNKKAEHGDAPSVEDMIWKMIHMDTLPSENTSVIPVEPESLDDEVGDLGEPAIIKLPCLTLIRPDDSVRLKLGVRSISTESMGSSTGLLINIF